MTCLLLLISKKSYRAHDFLEAAERLKVEVVVGSDHRQTLEELNPGRSLYLNFSDLELSSKKIQDFSRTYPIDSVVAAEDDGVLLAAHAAKLLGIAHNPVEAAATTRNKFLLRRQLSMAGLPQPSFKLSDVSAEPGGIVFPCVLKPLFLSAGRGVMRANDLEELRRCLERLAKILSDPEVREMGGALADKVLVETFIPGKEVALEGILDRGKLLTLAIFDKPDPLDGPFFEETLYVTPSRLPVPLQQQIEQTVSRAAAALGLITGPIHAELRFNETGIYLIEMAARSIGGICSRSLRFGVGITLEELILRQAMGDLQIPERESKAAGAMMIPIPKAGILKAVEGKEEASRVPLIQEIDIMIPIGQEVVPLPEGSRYLGFIFARGNRPVEVESALREAHRRLQFRIDPL